MPEQYFCPWDKSWHKDELALLQYCKSNGWIDDKATFEDLEKRLDSVAGGVTMADNTEPVQKPWPKDVPKPKIFGKEL